MTVFFKLAPALMGVKQLAALARTPFSVAVLSNSARTKKRKYLDF
jgi:hypothetical protein